MNQTRTYQTASEPPTNTVVHGDCIAMMRAMNSASIDFILTDPPYLQNYHSRDGRGLWNDTTDYWLKPAFAEAYLVLKPNHFCVCFYSWPKADKFLAAWRSAGFVPWAILYFANRMCRKHDSFAISMSKRISWRRASRPSQSAPSQTCWR